MEPALDFGGQPKLFSSARVQLSFNHKLHCTRATTSTRNFPIYQPSL